MSASEFRVAPPAKGSVQFVCRPDSGPVFGRCVFIHGCCIMASRLRRSVGSSTSIFLINSLQSSEICDQLFFGKEYFPAFVLTGAIGLLPRGNGGDPATVIYSITPRLQMSTEYVGFVGDDFWGAVAHRAQHSTCEVLAKQQL